MLILNVIAALIGFFGWFWVWSRSHYQTGSDFRTQIGVILLGMVWVLVLVADLVEGSEPKVTIFIVRVIFIISLLLLKPLLTLTPLLSHKNLMLLIEDKDVINLLNKKSKEQEL